MNYSDYISVDPEIRFGRPCLTGTQIAVYEILALISNGASHEQLMKDYPDLSVNAIQACLEFAMDHHPKLSA